MSNNLTRILVAVVAIPLVLLLTYFDGYPFLVFVLILQIFCMFELFLMFKNLDIISSDYLAVIISSLIFLNFIFFKQYLWISAILIFGFLTYEFFIAKRNSFKSTYLLVFGVVYITLPFALLYNLDKNYLYVFLLMILIWAGDSFAYFGGRLFGKHKFSKISPNKTIEGLIIGFIFTIIVSFIFHLIVPNDITLIDSIISGTIVGILGPIGDLFESFLKRYTGVKDSSNIIPGHGGVLDRFDSLIFTVPFLYLYLVIIKYSM